MILTDACNLCCTYCRGKIFDTPELPDVGGMIDEDLPPELDYDLNILYDFLAKDDDPVVTFYGGEPLLRYDLVREIMENAPVEKYIMHTNGTLLGCMDRELINRLNTLFISIDGPETINDRHRGAGTFRLIMDNLRTISSGGFSGEIIGRMTVVEDTDIYDAVRFLADNSDFSFSSIHWQLDANFWNDFEKRSFPSWVNKSYNPGIRKLIRCWVDHMQEYGEVLRWYPFLDTMEDLLLERKSAPLRCGAGHSNYSIMTDGAIAPCPCMVGMSDYYLGNIQTNDPSDIGIVPIGHDCLNCNLLDFCGGRCLYSNIMHPWPEEGCHAVYSTVKNLNQALKEVLPEVKELIGRGDITLRDFDHVKYHGCEIIP